MGAGKVDFKNLWKNECERRRRIRWRTLQSTHNSGLVSIFGYAVNPNGPWFGYVLPDLINAPCVHCGQSGVFRPETWVHECTGFYQGHRLPCAEGIPALETSHPCRGEPSMSYSTSSGGGPSLWRSADWQEVPVLSR